MDKSDVKVHESQSDTSSVITMKEYAPSEYPSSEPPPAYMKPRSNALRIAKLAAFTVIVSSIILGGFILAASWIQANTARNLDLTLNQTKNELPASAPLTDPWIDASDPDSTLIPTDILNIISFLTRWEDQELLDDLHPSYEHLVANEVLPDQQTNEVDQEQAKDENQASVKVADNSNKNNDEGLLPPPPPPSSAGKTEEKKALELDEIANILMQKNIKGNVNCIVEKRRNEELVDHAPMSLNLPSGSSPFGLNITTPPRLQHLTGEQMIVICKGDEDEDKNSESDEDGEEEEGKVDQLQSVVFPLPSHLLNQIQQIPQIIPLNNLLQQLPVQQNPVQQLQMQHVPVQQLQVQQIPVQQLQMQQIPVQQLQVQQIPIQQIPLQQVQLPPQQQPQIFYQQPMMVEPPQQQQHYQQPQQQPIALPQRLMFQPQQMVNQPQPNVQFVPEMTPLKEVRINEDRIPMNHILHHRVPINPMAENDVPLSRMPITHLPIRAEPPMREEPMPVHHLMPPQQQQYQAENFGQEESRFNGPIVPEQTNRFPFFSPQFNQQKPLPVEVRDPGAMRMPVPMSQEPRERYPLPPPPNQMIPNNFVENREQEIMNEPPNRGFRHLIVDVRPRGQRREPLPNLLMPEMPEVQKISSMIPMNLERRPQNNGRRIRFPEMVDSEEVKENPIPIITEITKIIPIRLEKEEPEVNEAPIMPFHSNPQQKNVDANEIKLEKLPPRPFPIPINAILDMIFRGIRPLMNNRGHSLPIPIDIKIERIENKPIGLTPPFIKKFEVIKKETPNALEAEDIFQNSNIQSILSEKNESLPDKDVVEAKVERVEIFNKEPENNSAPTETQEPQIIKIEGPSAEGPTDGSSFEDQAFLPNGQGRGARVFPIPQAIKEAEIFSVFDAKSDKNVNAEIPVESSLTVVNPEKDRPSEVPENRQARFMGFPGPILNFFPVPEEKVMKPLIQIPKVQPQTFAAPESRSVKLYPVSDAGFKPEEPKPMAAVNIEENRPHFVQPRSV